MLRLNNLVGFGGRDTDPKITYRDSDSADTGGELEHTFSGASFGSGKKHVAVCVTFYDGGNRDVTSVTVDGEATSQVAEAIAGNDRTNAFIFITDAETVATSGDIVITGGGGGGGQIQDVAITVYSVENLSSTTPIDTGSDSSHASNVMDVSANTPGGACVALACFVSEDSNAIDSMVGITEDADFTWASTVTMASGSANISGAAETPRTITGTFNNAPNREAACSAVFQ